MKLELDRENVYKTEQDKISEQLQRAGQTKYKTLTQIRQGTARRRIDQYENL